MQSRRGKKKGKGNQQQPQAQASPAPAHAAAGGEHEEDVRVAAEAQGDEEYEDELDQAVEQAIHLHDLRGGLFTVIKVYNLHDNPKPEDGYLSSVTGLWGRQGRSRADKLTGSIDEVPEGHDRALAQLALHSLKSKDFASSKNLAPKLIEFMIGFFKISEADISEGFVQKCLEARSSKEKQIDIPATERQVRLDLLTEAVRSMDPDPAPVRQPGQ